MQQEALKPRWTHILCPAFADKFHPAPTCSVCQFHQLVRSRDVLAQSFSFCVLSGDCLEDYCNLSGEGNITAHVWPYKRHHASARHGDIIMSNCRVVSHARSSPTGMSWCKSCRVGCVWPLSMAVGQNSLKPYAQDVWYAMQQRHTTQMWEYLSLTTSQLHMRTWRQGEVIWLWQSAVISTY